MIRLLLLDADKRHAHEMAVYLKSHGYFVEMCHNGQDAIGVLRRSQTAFDVLVHCIAGDRTDNWELLEFLQRVIEPERSAPGILCVLTADRGPNVILAAERRGARCVIEG
jgi:CheY-like chemotaxis protein